MRMYDSDVTVIGGGIVGLAAAYALTQAMPGLRVTLLEKEGAVALHQTGHNSGVLHSGIYYKPGSLRAATCRDGKKKMEAFCARAGIEFRICGKVIVATREDELPALQALYERGIANGIDCRIIDATELRDLEPHASGIKAIHVREAGVVNYSRVCEQLARLVTDCGGSIVTGARVDAVREESEHVEVRTADGRRFTSSYVVNCAGLHSDRVASFVTKKLPLRIVPFRGEYYRISDEAASLCRTLIYPVPDPRFPFLGVHVTRSVEGEVECGPNAVLAFAREGYTLRDISLRDMAEMLAFPGFLRLALRHWRTAVYELWRSVNRRAFLRSVQRLVPAIKDEHLSVAPAGVRAQAIGYDGKLVDDFVVVGEGRVINILNAPSPAATASLAIGDLIVDRLRQLGLTQSSTSPAAQVFAAS